MKTLFSFVVILTFSFSIASAQTATGSSVSGGRVDLIMNNLKKNLSLTATQEAQIRTITTQTETQVQQIIASGKSQQPPVEIKTVYANQEASITALLTPAQQTVYHTLNRYGEKTAAK